MFGNDILICDNNHGLNPLTASYRDVSLEVKNIKIGQGCWIGDNVCILPGVTIGEKVILGTGSIVTKNIPAYTIAVGNPAKVVKKYNMDVGCWESV